MLKNTYLIILSFCLAVSVMLFSPLTVIADGETATSLAQLKQDIAADMTDRETTFTIHYTGDANQVPTDIKSIFHQALGSNDYLSLAWKKMSYHTTVNSGKHDITFTAEYYTTKEEEEFIDSKVKTLVASLTTPSMSYLTKETAIHNWIVNNVSYDYTLQQRTAYTALTTGKTVCMGYAMLMEKMLNQAGIDSKIVTGNIPQGYHAWNMVKLDNDWYYIDVTGDWATGSTIPQNKTENEMIQNNYVWDKTSFPQTGIH